MFDLSDLHKLRYENMEKFLWISFYDCRGNSNTFKCGLKSGEDIYRFYQFFRNQMFRDYDVQIHRWLKKDSFIIIIIENVKSSN